MPGARRSVSGGSALDAVPALPEPGLHVVAMVSLELDPALLRGAAGRHRSLQLPGHLLQGARVLEPLDPGDGLAVPPRVHGDPQDGLLRLEVLADTDFLWQAAGIADLTGQTRRLHQAPLSRYSAACSYLGAIPPWRKSMRRGYMRPRPGGPRNLFTPSSSGPRGWRRTARSSCTLRTST